MLRFKTRLCFFSFFFKSQKKRLSPTSCWNVSLNIYSSGVTQADLPLLGQWRDPKQQEKGAGIHPGFCSGYCQRFQTRLQVSFPRVDWNAYIHASITWVLVKLWRWFDINATVWPQNRLDVTVVFTPCLFPCRDGEEGCKKQLGRVLSIWQERAVYENNLLDQLSQVLCKLTQEIMWRFRAWRWKIW